jgi:hypothetical protein
VAQTASYLLRDSIKVIGAAEQGLQPTTMGLFYLELLNPLSGGTGFTLKVCHQNKVPVIYQDVYMKWSF